MEIAHKDILSEAFMDACSDIDIPIADDYNGGNYEGAHYAQMSQFSRALGGPTNKIVVAPWGPLGAKS